ncbi:MAG: hypothetical protein MJB14_12220, partial [Spirochaetes bacterium]|nr:hypothetical protein [Spirochaetota bacterium]
MKKTTADQVWQDKEYRFDELVIHEKIISLFVNQKKMKEILTINEDVELLVLGCYYNELALPVKTIINNTTQFHSSANLSINKKSSKLQAKQTLPVCQHQSIIDIHFSLVNNIFTDFNHQSQLFQQTAGVHGCGLYNEDGVCLIF